VTTSLRTPPTPTRRGRHRAIQAEPPEVVLTHNGVPRSSWFRAARRRSTWHRGYALSLVFVDCAATALASFTAISVFAQADAGFQHQPGLFTLVAYVFLPLCWLIILWGHGAYDRRYLGVGSDEFKRVFRASTTVAATVSFLAFALKIDLSRLSVGTALVGALVYVMVGRWAARRMLVLARWRGWAVHRVLLVGTLPEAIEVYTAVSRVPAAGLVPVGIHLMEG
jgi:FlaA1/EpsC-like NDP-sugar epimerase